MRPPASIKIESHARSKVGASGNIPDSFRQHVGLHVSGDSAAYMRFSLRGLPLSDIPCIRWLSLFPRYPFDAGHSPNTTPNPRRFAMATEAQWRAAVAMAYESASCFQDGAPAKAPLFFEA